MAPAVDAVDTIPHFDRFKIELDLTDEFLNKYDPDNKETPELRAEKVQELLTLLNEEPDIITRTDDANLLRFLRAKYFKTEIAFQQLKNYESFKTEKPDWLDTDMDIIRKMTLNGNLQVLPSRDQLGRRILYIQGGKWIPSECDAESFLKGGALMGDITILEPGTQVAGIVVIMNLKDVGFTQFRGLSPAFAKRMVHFLAFCLPARIIGIHFVNEPGIFSMLFAIFKAFLTERMRKRLHFHGCNLSSLHEHVCPEALPSELGGALDDIDPKQFYDVLTSDLVIKELKTLGYKFENLEAQQQS